MKGEAALLRRLRGMGMALPPTTQVRPTTTNGWCWELTYAPLKGYRSSLGIGSELDITDLLASSRLVISHVRVGWEDAGFAVLAWRPSVDYTPSHWNFGLAFVEPESIATGKNREYAAL